MRYRAPNRSQGINRGRISIGKAIPAPVGGWDAQSPLADMPPENAVTLQNWIPRSGFVELRKGFVTWQDGLSLPVETGMVLRGSGTDRIFGAAGGSIYDMTGQGDVPVEVYTETGSARFQWINFANDAGTFILAANGAAPPIRFNGTDWAPLTITGTAGILTLDPASLVDVMEHKGRTFWVENNTLRVWFLAPNAIQGAADLLDLGPIFDKGGTIISQATWSVDGGSGADDLAVWVTSEGQVAVYQGLDPSDANEWALVGVYDIGLPLSRRALIKYGADLVVLTTDGVVPLSQALQLDRAQENLVALTAKIQPAFLSAATRYRNNFGWEGCLYQRGSLAIFNVPIAELSVSEQYVQNVQTGAWCRFTGINAFCWFTANDDIFFGGADGIYQWDQGATDGGEILVADMVTAYNYFGSRGDQKQFKSLQPIYRSSVDIFPRVEVFTDFKTGVPNSTPTIVSNDNSLWDVALWDVGRWAEDVESRDSWTGLTGLGYCGAVAMRVDTSPAFFTVVDTGDEGLLEDQTDGSLIQADQTERVSSVVEVIAFNLKYENQRGGQF